MIRIRESSQSLSIEGSFRLIRSFVTSFGSSQYSMRDWGLSEGDRLLISAWWDRQRWKGIEALKIPLIKSVVNTGNVGLGSGKRRAMKSSRCALRVALVCTTTSPSFMSQSEPTPLNSTETDVLSQIFTPGSTRLPFWKAALDVCFSALFCVFVFLAYVSHWNKHVFGLMGVEICLWLSVKWYASFTRGLGRVLIVGRNSQGSYTSSSVRI
jgi:hypothetical protein